MTRLSSSVATVATYLQPRLVPCRSHLSLKAVPPGARLAKKIMRESCFVRQSEKLVDITLLLVPFEAKCPRTVTIFSRTVPTRPREAWLARVAWHQLVYRTPRALVRRMGYVP